MKNLIFVSVLAIFLVSCSQNKQVEVSQSNENQNTNIMSKDVFFSTTLEGDYDTILNRVVEAFANSKFGLINDIDFQAKLYEKLGEENVDLKRYRILGICNPAFAYKAIQAENKIGVMLPCKVIVRETNDNKVEVSSLNPGAIMGMLGNDELTKTGEEVGAILKQVIESLQ